MINILQNPCKVVPFKTRIQTYDILPYLPMEPKPLNDNCLYRYAQYIFFSSAQKI